jgi:anaphase-promoting complex subunit 1
LPTLVQSAALLAVGLLYQGSAHRLTTEILLAEIGRKPGGDNALDREGYALAAGLALGLVTLGRGRDAWGLADLHIEDRLRHYMSGGSDTIDERQRRFDGTVSSINSVSRGIDDQSQVMEGSTVNLDVTAPGATLALGLMFLKTNCEVVAARLAVPDTHFALEYVRPDFILLRLVARSLILWDSVQPTEEWIQAQIPGIVKEAMLVSSKEDGSPELPLNSDADLEALAQAHVNILAGACLSIGLRYAGTASVEAQQSLRHYALYFMNEKRAAVPHGAAASPNNRRQYVDRSTLETCLNIAVLSLSLVMAGTGHLETFRLLRFLRRRTDADGITFGNQMAISMAIGFLFLGGGGLTFATNNGAVAALLIALYPRFPTAPNDHRCHLQAFRHLYVLATEKRCLQTVDVDTGLPVYVPIEMTLKETAHYGETTFSRVTPCILPERNLLKRVRVCGPRYWPQDIELPAVDKPWWEPGESGPFDGGTLYVKRKVGARSYADDPIGCRSLLSRAIHKSGDGNCSQAAGRSQLSEVDQLVSTFSADPSILAFAQLFCSRADNRESSGEFDNFCLQALYESVSTDRPALLQTYMALYTSVGALIDRASGRGTSANSICSDSLSIYSLKIAVAYCDIIDQSAEGKPLVQRTFLTGLAKRVDDILNSPSLFSSEAQNPELKPFFSELFVYLDSRQFPLKQARQSDYGLKWTSALDTRARCILFSCFLCWYGIPQPRRITSALQQLVHEVPGFQNIIRSDLHSALPVLALALPSTPLPALLRISECLPALSLAQFR